MAKKATASSNAAKKTGSKTGAKKSVKRKKPTATAVKQLDQQIVKLLNERADQIAELLRGEEDPAAALYDPTHDEQLLKTAVGLNKGDLPEQTLRRVFQEVISAAKRRIRVQRVVYLGPEFSFSHLAAIERFGQSADLVPVNTIGAVFEEVNRGHAMFGIVPIENSTDGRVVDTLSMFGKLPVRICGEVQLQIHLHLLANGPRGQITEVYSKPQALSQCRNWLARNMPQARLIEVTSTSTAAQLARTKPGAAAVASQQAAVDNGLTIQAENIEDNPHNITRFAVIGEDICKRSGKDRTAVLLQVAHQPGALHDALMAFKKNKINLTWIESFPLFGAENGYQFFLDFEGHADDAAISRVLSDLEKKAVRMELLGSYPRSLTIG
ncbi:prephenate dehydratase [Stratiformator vulcanicus]|uniref:Bifunctional chorismate mutase/prephenate dehydratase n=1 Tax=Stratiformator vulcanicus TaxID=2527980 RepID=A0A517R6D3_9PLAN|nr:prephenate dehydratase [Stratiformator vulcanicus]QDT39457.1 P-protein [Stratiformator vulcanicus]